MTLINPSGMLLTHQVTIQTVSGTNEFQEPAWSDPMILSGVKIERANVWSGSGNNRTLTKTLKLYVFKFNNPDFELSETDTIRFIDENGVEHSAASITINTQDDSNEIYSWEIEAL
jgi:hypothetical protein